MFCSAGPQILTLHPGVVTWGNGDFAPDCYTAQELLQDAQFGGGYAIGSDGSVLNFGRRNDAQFLPEPTVQSGR